MEAARHWALVVRQAMQQPQQDKAADEQERKTAGVSPEDWEQAFEWDETQGRWAEAGSGAPAPGAVPGAPEPFVVWPCNWAVVLLFVQCSTTWRRAGMGGYEGMDYPGVDVVLRRRQVKKANKVFCQLQAMERAALEVLNG